MILMLELAVAPLVPLTPAERVGGPDAANEGVIRVCLEANEYREYFMCHSKLDVHLRKLLIVNLLSSQPRTYILQPLIRLPCDLNACESDINFCTRLISMLHR